MIYCIFKNLEEREIMSRTQYVDNKRFYDEMSLYHTRYKEAEACGEDPPRVNDYIGKCLYEMANRLSHKPNFINYPFREEMVGDGIENAIKCISNFDPTKSTNPFAYFTQVIYYAFLRRIAKEKKALYIKHKVMERNIIENSLLGFEDDSDVNVALIPTEYMNEFVKNFEESMEEKKKVIAKKKGIEKFCEEEEDEDSDSDRHPLGC